MLRPARRAGPGRTASASRRLRWVQPAHRPAAAPSRRSPTESCALPPSPVTRMHRAVACAGPDRSRRGRPDPDRVTRMPWMHPVAARAGPGQCQGEADPDRATWMRRRERGRQRIRRSHPHQNLPRQSALHSRTHPHRRCQGVPDRCRGRARRRQGSAPLARQAQSRDRRRRPDAAPGPALDRFVPPIERRPLSQQFLDTLVVKLLLLWAQGRTLTFHTALHCRQIYGRAPAT